MCGRIALALSVLVACVAGSTIDDHRQRVVCYLGSWAVYRPARGRFMISDIDPFQCTHVVYAFAGLDQSTNEIKSLDPEYDLTKGGYEHFVQLKNRNPRLKTSIAIGGWTEGSKKYSNMAGSRTNRTMFVNSVVNFIKKHGFDGLDLDWEYPANRGGVPQDKDNFVTLVKELRNEFNKYGWLLTAATAASKSVVDTAYDIPSIVDYIDYIHIMAYDYHGKWDGFTGHNAPLYSREDESDSQKTLNVDYTVRYYLKQGAPPHKLVLGLGLYGRTFLLTDPTQVDMKAPVKNTAFAGPYTRENGFLGYNEICETQRNETGQWNTVWQRSHQAPYMFRDDKWVSFDDDLSIGLKVAYAQELGLAGVMVWSIDTDDFRGSCGSGRFPLLNAINKALDEGEESRPDVAHKDINFIDNNNIDDNFRYSPIGGGASTGYIAPATLLISVIVACILSK